jgi:beta-mannosidase
MPYNMGSLYWQLDDCWPVASWSGIDYFGRWKALHHFARHFFAPALVSPVEEGGTVRIFGVSDLREDKPARLVARLVDFDGHERWRKESDVVLSANSSHVLQSMSKRDALKGADPTQVVLVTQLLSGGQLISRNNLYFVKTRELALPAPGLTLSAELHEGGATVRVTAGKLARNVWLSTTAAPGEPPLEGMFSDNFFDVLPGETVTVTWTPRIGGAAVDASRLRAALHALTIRDTY